MVQNPVSNANVGDVLKDSLSRAMSDVVHALEPQLNEFANRYTHKAIDRSRVIATAAAKRIVTQPWYLVGAAALLMVGSAIMIGFQKVDQEEIMHH